MHSPFYNAVDRGRRLEVCRSVAGNDAEQKRQDNGPERGNKNAHNEAVISDSSETKVTRQKTSDECPYQSDDHVSEHSKARALHELAGEPARDDADDDPCDESM